MAAFGGVAEMTAIGQMQKCLQQPTRNIAMHHYNFPYSCCSTRRTPDFSDACAQSIILKFRLIDPKNRLYNKIDALLHSHCLNAG
jgi:hypothetical protein